MTGKTTAQFWAGYFSNEKVYLDFVTEDPTYDPLADQGELGPQSNFSTSQGQECYGAGELETGFSFANSSNCQNAFDHPSALFWKEKFDKLAMEKSIHQPNAFLLIELEEPEDPVSHEWVHSPRDVRDDAFQLVYLGRITYQN